MYLRQYEYLSRISRNMRALRVNKDIGMRNVNGAMAVRDNV